jgi:hypothetical protein
MLGLDAAGKTTILYKLHIGEVLSTVPTIGMLLITLSQYFFFRSCPLCEIRKGFTVKLVKKLTPSAAEGQKEL